MQKVGGINTEARFWSFIDWADEWNDTSGMPTAGLKGPLAMETLLNIYGLQQAGYLTNASRVVNTPAGKIRVSRRIEDGGIQDRL